MTAFSAITALQVLCAVAFVPHALAKARNPGASVGLFGLVGLRPPLFWIWTAVVIELVVAACLILDIATPWAALAGGVFLLAAGAAVLRASGGKWRWNEGGGEFPIFWGLCCLIVAVETWPAP